MIDGGDRPSSSSLSVSVPSADAMLVEFPGYVRDVRAAMEVLGGEQVRDNEDEKGRRRDDGDLFFFSSTPTSTPLSNSTENKT